MRTRSLYAGAAALLALLALLAASWWLQGDGEQAPPDAAPAAMPAPATPLDAQVADLERNELDPAPTSISPPDAEPTSPGQSTLPQDGPWRTRFLVVDQDDAPVADAIVTIRESNPIAGARQQVTSEQVLLELRTDWTGRAETTLPPMTIVADARKGEARSGRRLLSSGDGAAEARLKLDVPITLRGIVLRTDGRPAAGAEVVTSATTLRAEPVPEPPVVTSGPDGRFELPVFRHAGYGLIARLGSERSFRNLIQVAEQAPEVTLTFPGGITIHGIGVDLDGNPVVNAEVNAWRERGAAIAPGDDPHERARGRSGLDGRFTLPVRAHARYQVMALAGDRGNSAVQWVETTAARPHVEVRLQMLLPVPIRGRIERGDGSPFGGVYVTAVPEAAASATPGLDDLRFPPAGATRTRDDGTFEISVHPDTTWTVLARPVDNQLVEVRRAGVRPGAENVVLRVTDDQLAGSSVHIDVAGADGRRIDSPLIQVGEYDAGKVKWLAAKEATAECVSHTLSRDRQYMVFVSPPRSGPVAPTVSGPFWTDRAEMEVKVRLEAWGELPVRVLGAPAGRTIRVHTVRAAGAMMPEIRNEAQPLADDGCVVLEKLLPGAQTLRVTPDRGPVFEQAVVVLPGLNPEVVVRLPATK